MRLIAHCQTFQLATLSPEISALALSRAEPTLGRVLRSRDAGDRRPSLVHLFPR